MSDTTEGDEPTLDQQRLLDAIWQGFRGEDSWPSYSGIDQVMDREGLQARSLIESMPRGLMYPDIGALSHRWFPRPQDQLRLQVAGLRYCHDTEDDLKLLARLLRYFADREKSRALASLSNPEPFRIRSSEAAADLALSAEQVARAYHLLDSFEWRVRGSGGGNPDDWSWEIDVEEVRRYRDVETTADYLQARREGDEAVGRRAAQTTQGIALPPAEQSAGQQPPRARGRRVRLSWRPLWRVIVAIGVLAGIGASIVTIRGGFSVSGAQAPRTTAGSFRTTPKPPPGGKSFVEIESTLGAPTFRTPGPSGPGEKIPANARVRVACKTYAPTIGSASPRGYWYLIASKPWNDHYVSVANTFINGGSLSGPGVRYVDSRVPNCH